MERIGFRPEFVYTEPKKVYVELTSRCNLDCSICYRRSWQQQPGDMDKSQLEKLVKELRAFKSQPEVVLGGIGEPTHSPEFLDTVDMLKGLPLTVTSNGTLLADKRITEAVAQNVNRLVISVDGCDETYYRIRGTSLTNVVDGIKMIKSEGTGPEIQLQFVLSVENRDSIWQVIDLAAQLRVQGVIISNLLPQTLEYSKKILYSAQHNPEMKQFFNRVCNYSFVRGVTISLPGYELKTDRRCRFIDGGGVVVNALGDVTPCYRFAHPGREYVFDRPKEVVRHSFGNLSDKTLVEIWNQRDYRRFRYSIYCNLFPSCTDCDLVDGCEIVNTTTWDCEGNMPTCGDCLWARNFVICP
jgi:tungsten cofactor oxidoreducase radical SAM maturase